jgi:hypothetical protein
LGLFKQEQQETCVRKSVYSRRKRKAGMGSRGSVAGSLFIEGDKQRQEKVVISAWGLLSWPQTHFMA